MSQSRTAEITSIEPVSKTDLQPTQLIMDNASMSSTSSSSDSNNLSSPNTSSIYSDQLLDHSHLKPGKQASLLSYDQTLTMYRENAAKTNNPDIQCDFALFLLEAADSAEAEKILKQLSLKGHPMPNTTWANYTAQMHLTRKARHFNYSYKHPDQATRTTVLKYLVFEGRTLS